MKQVTYDELAERFGQEMADELLQVIEESCSTKAPIASFDKNERFHLALIGMREDNLVA